MNRLLFYLLLFALPAPMACDQEGGPNALPPARGPGSPDGPEIPKLSADSSTVATASAADHFIGTLHTRRSADIATKLTGTIATMSVEEGDTVKKGQALFRLDRRQAQLGVEQAEAAIASAKSMLDSTKRELARVEALAARGSVPPATLDNARSATDNAEIGLRQAKIGLDMALRSLADMSVKAPLAGTVTAKYKNEGETVTSMPPTIVLTIQDQSSLELRVQIPERELAGVEENSTLRVRFPALGEEREVTVTRTGSVVDPRTRSVEVYAQIENGDSRLRPGMSVEVRLPRKPSDDPNAGNQNAADSTAVVGDQKAAG